MCYHYCFYATDRQPNGPIHSPAPFPLLSGGIISSGQQEGLWAGLKQRGLGSILLWLSFRFQKVVVCGHCLVTLSLTINETLKCLSSLCILMRESFWWGQWSERYRISLFPHLHTPFSLSLISLMVPVNIKNTYLRVCYLGVSCVLVYLCLADVN